MDFNELKKRIGLPDDEPQSQWHQHANPNGTLGGWVANSASVAPTATVSPEAVVQGDSRIEDTSEVKGAGRVIDAVLADHSVVEGQGIAIGGAFRGEVIQDEVRIRGSNLDGGRAGRQHPRVNYQSSAARRR